MRPEINALKLVNPARFVFLTRHPDKHVALLEKLAGTACHALVATNIDALQRMLPVERESLDGIIIDMITPGLDVEALFEWLKANDVTPPVMLLEPEGGISCPLDAARGIRLASRDAGIIATVAYCGAATMQREREWRQYVARLESEAEERTRNLEAARAETEENYRHLQQAQGQLVQSEKLACVGQISAGIAHEINNPIGFIYSNMTTLKDYIEDIRCLDTDAAELRNLLSQGKQDGATQLAKQIDEWHAGKDVDYILEDIESLVKESIEGAERVKRIVMDLRTFCRDEQDRKTTADINKGIESTLNLCRNELKYHCEIIKELGDVPEIACYPAKLNQVFMNLIINAAQAIKGKGKITIRSYCRDDNMYIQVSDTGEGIPPENLPRIFDPFFTTKPVGRGTGLGLSLACKMIQDHGGEITAQSTLGEGATFTIRLPLEANCDAQPLAAR